MFHQGYRVIYWNSLIHFVEEQEKSCFSSFKGGFYGKKKSDSGMFLLQKRTERST
jgi:hypothetical protein